jgi:hypothetical protein
MIDRETLETFRNLVGHGILLALRDYDVRDAKKDRGFGKYFSGRRSLRLTAYSGQLTAKGATGIRG